MNDCDLPYVSVADIEDQIEQYYQTIKLDRATADSLYGHIVSAAKKRNARALRMAKHQRKRIKILENGGRLAKDHSRSVNRTSLRGADSDRGGTCRPVR